jgi:ABC-type branched-subunit amino acid transport system substrate-binding protein
MSSSLRAAGTSLAVVALVAGLAGCTGGGSDASPTPSAATGPRSVLVGGGLGEVPLDGLADATLTGTTAVIPGAVVSDDLNTRLQQSAPRVAADRLRFAPEAYDAVVLAALAAAAAQTDAGPEVAAQVGAVSAGGARCASFEECLPLVQKGADLDYDGAAGPLPIGPTGSPTEASVAVATFDASNTLPGIDAPADPAAPVTYQSGKVKQPSSSASAAPSGTTTAPGAGDGVLTLATVLPMSGPFSALGRAEVAAVRLAVADIDAAGGVFGRDVALDVIDSGDPTTTDAATLAANAVAAGADVVVGGGAEGLGVPLVAPVAGAGAVLFSPADASAEYGDAAGGGLAFRTVAPPEVLGDVAGRLAEGGTSASVGLLVPRGAAGRVVANSVSDAVDAAGGQVSPEVSYGTSDRSQTAAVTKVAETSPEAVVVSVTDDPTALLTAVSEAGLLASGSATTG